MTSSCDRIHELLVAEAAGAESWSEPVETHLQGCEVCASTARRLRLHARALSELQPVPAPEGLDALVRRGFGQEHRVQRAVASLMALRHLEAPETLDGKVVASANGGHRQDRAVEKLSVLDSRRAPQELDRRLESIFSTLREDGVLPQPTAPQELEERVDHDLRDLPATMTRRFMGKLGRLTAPPILSRRVDDELRRETPGKILPFRRWSIAAAAAAAAGLALWIGFQSPDGPGSTDPLPFPDGLVEIVFLDDPGALSATAQSFADHVTGGAHGTLASFTPEMLEAAIAASAGGASTSRPGGTPAAPPASRGGSNASTSAPSTNTTTPTGSRGSADSLIGSTTGPTFLDKITDAPFVTAYRGMRHTLDRLSAEGGQVLEFEVLEQVASDGQGNFTVQVEDVLAPPMPQVLEDQHALLQSFRVGFTYRYRDFRIRDQQRFWQNYLVIDQGVLRKIAGLDCAVLEVRRHDGRGNVHTIAVESSSGLILREEEHTPNGLLVRKVWYESFQFDADLSDLQLTGGPSQWAEFDLNQPGAVGFGLLPPSAPPSGFLFEAVGTRTGADPSGATWVRFVYGDGAEQVFFMHSDESLKPGDPAVIGITSDRVRVAQYGAWTVAEGKIRGLHTIAIGKVDVNELLLMLQSAIE